MSMLEVQNLKSGYGPIPVLHGVSLSVEAGEIVAIVGPNGAGKTTLMKTIFGLLPASEGSVHFDGQDVTHMRTTSLAELGMGYLPQGSNTFPELSVEDNLRVAAHSLKRSKADERLRAVFAEFPVLESAAQAAGEAAVGRRAPDPRARQRDRPAAPVPRARRADDRARAQHRRSG